MNIRSLLVSASLMLASTLAAASDGLIAVKSPHSAKTTMDRLESIVKERGLNVFIRVDHAAGAAKIGKTLRPTEVLVFGNPQGGTPFMECAQAAGIDLPLKALVWQDAASQVWLGYKRPGLAGQTSWRGGLPRGGEPEQGARSHRERGDPALIVAVIPRTRPAASIP